MQNETKSNSQPIPSPMPQDLHPSSGSQTGMVGQGVAPPSLPPGNRDKRRAAKKKGLPPLIQSDSRYLHHRVSQVETNQERLANLVDQNNEAFADGLKMSEAMALVLQRVLNEMVGTTGSPMHRGPSGGINFQEYLREYWLCMLMADFARWCGTIATHDKPLIETVSKADVIEFGG